MKPHTRCVSVLHQFKIEMTEQYIYANVDNVRVGSVLTKVQFSRKFAEQIAK